MNINGRFAVFFRRVVPAALCLLVAGIASGAPAAQSASVRVAVFGFTNAAHAPSSLPAALSQALYRGAGSGGTRLLVGDGPIALPLGAGGDRLAAALAACTKAGAGKFLIGDLIEFDGSTAVYRLSSYGVQPLRVLGSQVFSQTVALHAGAPAALDLAADVAALDARRPATGTIYSVDDGIHADVGSAEGFRLGERFNVVRNGMNVAQVQIASIDSGEAVLVVTSAFPGFKPAVGDRVVSIDRASLSTPPPADTGHFNPLATALAIGAALIAIGHHGQPAVSAGASPTPVPSQSPFTVSVGTAAGTAPSPVTLSFVFSQPVSATSQFAIAGTIADASVQIGALSLGNPEPLAGPHPEAANSTWQVTFDSTGQVLSIVATGLSPGQRLQFTFTSGITDAAGQTLSPPAPFVYSAFAARHQLGAVPAQRPLGPTPKRVLNPSAPAPAASRTPTQRRTRVVPPG